MQHLVSLGSVLIFIGFLIVAIGLLSGSKDPNTKVAVGGFIGFIPFGFGNDKKLVWFVTALSVMVFLFWLLFSLRIFKGA